MAKQTSTISSEAPEQPQNSVMISAGGAASQHTWRNIGLIIGREYKNRVKQRSFVISTIVLMIMIVIAAFVPTVIQLIASKTKTNTQTHITIVNNAGNIAHLSAEQLTQYIDTSLNGSKAKSGSDAGTPQFIVQTSTADQVDSLRQGVKNGNLDILLVIDRASDQSLQFTYYTNVSILNDPNQAQVQGLAEQLNVFDKSARFGLTPQQISSLFTQPAFNFVDAKPGAPQSTADQLAAYFTSYAGVVLIFFAVFMYGMGIATGVAEEKGSRIMEILVNAATPLQLMVGKIVGIGAAGVTQMVGLVALGIGALLLQNPLQHALLGTTSGLFSINLTSVTISILLFVLLYFILGFLLYATLFAALGSLVKRQDETQNAVQPLTWLFMVGYIASLIGGASSASTTWMRTLSFIPFWTPTVMLMRIGVGSASGLEVLISVLLMIVFTFLCTLFAARVYRFAVLMYGQRPGLGKLFSIIRAR